MNAKFLFTLFLLTSLGLSPVIGSSSSGFKQSDQEESFSVTFSTEPYQVASAENGLNQLQVEEFPLYGLPGNPLLPARSYNIAIPPAVDWTSLTVEVISSQVIDLEGTYTFPPAPPAVTWDEDQKVEYWGENEGSIVDGKNVNVYQKDAFFPSTQVKVVSYAQMRKWRYIQTLFTPVQYNPVTGKARLATEVQVKISYQFAQGGEAMQLELSDTLMDDQAAGMIYNFNQAQEWYQTVEQPAALPTGMGYVIITTNQIAAGSALLDDFVAHKQDLGYTAEVVTENMYGGLTGQAPNGTTEKVRQWLINNYLSKQILYVLLVGNPDPDDPFISYDPFGDIQMKLTWPHMADYEDAPSDYFYADLTGNWDLDGDTYFGEYADDFGPGGVDFAPEVYVGRIPVYTFEEGWQQALDSILQKTIDYDNAAGTDWRKSALLPMSFLDEYTDSAKLGERMKNDYLGPGGYNVYTMYQQIRGSVCDSVFTSDEPLVDGAVRNHWAGHPYGIVAWSAHGNPGGAWLNCDAGALFLNSDAPSLPGNQPAYVYEGSCYNGDPTDSSNISFALVKNGAIGSVGASDVSWYSPGSYEPNPYTASNFDLSYYFTKRIANNEPVGIALYEMKQSMTSNFIWYMNLVVYNLYGDPSTRIGEAIPPPSNDDFDNAEPITAMPFTNVMDTSKATVATDDPAFTNCYLNQGLATVWYKFTPSASGKLTVDTFGSNYDTVLGVWSGARGALKSHICNDDSTSLQSFAEAYLLAGKTYYIEIAQYNGSAAGLEGAAEPKSAAAIESAGGTLQVNATFDSNVIFYDGFESADLSAWSSCAKDGGDLFVSGWDMVGYYKLYALVDDNHSIYCTDQSPNAEKIYRARFYFAPNEIEMVNGDAHSIFYGSKSPSPVVLRVDIRRYSGNYQVRAGLVNDGTTWKWSSWFNLSDAMHFIELNWKAATGAGKNNGGLVLWIDGVKKASLSGIDNDTRRIDLVHIGAVAGIDSGTRGSYYFDEFESNRKNYIGP